MFSYVEKPKRGSVVHCDVAGLLPSSSHSGIYLSKKRIVSVNMNGEVVVEPPEEFLSLAARRIYVACNGKKVIHRERIAELAEKKIYDDYEYDLNRNNCHKFVCACVRGKFRGKYKMKGNYSERAIFWLQDVEEHLQKIEYISLDRFNWRVWDR